MSGVQCGGHSEEGKGEGRHQLPAHWSVSSVARVMCPLEQIRNQKEMVRRLAKMEKEHLENECQVNELKTKVSQAEEYEKVRHPFRGHPILLLVF